LNIIAIYVSIINSIPITITQLLLIILSHSTY